MKFYKEKFITVNYAKCDSQLHAHTHTPTNAQFKINTFCVGEGLKKTKELIQQAFKK